MLALTTDPFKVRHWMNARKLTPAQLSERSGLTPELVQELLAGPSRLSNDAVSRLASSLDVDVRQCAHEQARAAVVVCTAEQLRDSRRALYRANMHFYNYYTMATLPEHVGPVILDILCPAHVPPALNEGHLEPAITVNLGPGDIFGRWGEERSELTWRRLGGASAAHPWIVGDSYTEPSYCRHAYALAGAAPARIVSYTCRSRLGPIVERSNGWSDTRFGALCEQLEGPSWSASALRLMMDRRGHSAASLAAQLALDEEALRQHLAGAQTLSLAELRRAALALGCDYRLLLEPAWDHDALGKQHLDVRASAAGARRFRSYQVASTAMSSALPDLVGMFMRVQSSARPVLDLREPNVTHYLVTSGDLQLFWVDEHERPAQAALGPDDSVAVGEQVPHGFAGEGSLLRLGCGDGCGSAELLELSTTFQRAPTLARARRDDAGWGFEG